MALRRLQSRAVPAALLAAALACGRHDAANAPAGGAAATASGNEAVATLNGKNITAADLEAWMKDDLYKREVGDKPAGEVYDTKVQAIDSMVDDRLLADAATKAGTMPEQYLNDQVKKLGPVSDDEVKKFFDDNRARLPGDATLESYAARIRTHLESQRPDKVREELRKEARVTVLMQPPRTPIDATGPSRGPADAVVTMVEFSDYQCPFCKRAEPVVVALMQKYPTQLRLVYRHMPLDALHPRARAAAIAAVCADQQGKFWEYHDALFKNQNALADSDLEKYASDLGMDAAAFKTCRADPKSEERVNVDANAARAAGLNGTPAFFVNGILVSGARPIEDFTRWIDQEIAAKGGSGAAAAAASPKS
ncbi:MAG TPA: thioredoxin domain-containing protein [Myxococcota bacterium]|nr:thioredoxin domain-containing protein [Myxococcota bacterium]